MAKSNETKTHRRGLGSLFSKEAEEGYVPNREALYYALGLGGQNISFNMVNSWFFYFCNAVLGISAWHVGILTAVTRIWDGINDPIAGAIVDRRKMKPGQKLHPYLGKLPIFIGIFAMLLFTDFGLSEKWTIAVVFVVYVIWDMLYSFQDVALWGTLALISPHSAERSRVVQWVNIGISVCLAATGLIPMFMGLGSDAGLSEKTMFFIFGLVFGFGGELMSIFAAKTHERVILPPQAETVSLFEDFKILLHNRNILLLSLAQILGSLSITVPWIYFFKYCTSMNIMGLELNGEMTQFVYSAITAIPGAFAMFFAVKLAKLCGGMKRMLLANQITSLVIRIGVFFIGFDTPAKLIASAVVMSLTSILGVAQNIALRSLIADSVDRMEWKTGKRTEGLVSSFQNFTAKIQGALQLLINGAVLEALHFDQNLEGIAGQPEAFYKWQWPLFILGPAIGAALYLIPAFFIKDDPKEKAQIEQELAERRAAAAPVDTETV